MNELTNQLAKSHFENFIPILSTLQDQIMKILKNNGPMTRNELVKALKSARTTIYDNLIKLERLELIKKYNHNSGLIGRPLVYWEIV